MINIAICDDEKPFQEKMRKIIALYMEQKGVDFSIVTFDDGRDLLKYCAESDLNTIVFLDINMDVVDGIEIGTKIRELSSSIYIVFVTAYIKYSLEGYKVKAIRYIIKGDKNFGQSLAECVDAILEDMDYGIKKLEFDFREGKKELSIDNIVYIESNLHNIIFRVSKCKSKNYTMKATLNEIENRLNEFGFLRIHQSFLINIAHLKMVRTYVAEMDDGTELPIPRTKYRMVKDAYVEYKGEI
ncbi:LytR/AlgR family response regulator transcription factor [Bacteroides heparinolyticus]|uniref:LytR/AlgR family response regulator transcription factor n=7 Tax=Prevotella heparinolytica TaxID=28113 RepID=UPI0035A0E13B